MPIFEKNAIVLLVSPPFKRIQKVFHRFAFMQASNLTLMPKSQKIVAVQGIIKVNLEKLTSPAAINPFNLNAAEKFFEEKIRSL